MTPEERIKQLEDRLNMLEASDRYTIQKTTQFFDGRKIQFGTTHGSSLGTQTTQKISVYGVTPVVQAGAITAPTGPGGTYNQTQIQSIVVAVNSVRIAIKNFGITA